MTRVGLLKVIGIMHGTSGAPAPVNTVPPAIPASAVIGTQLVTTPGTWTGASVLTYQWQRNTGSWVDIAGATNANYTPVDADFGRALRVVETANGSVSANSNDTGLTAEAPVQSLGGEIVLNGGMEVGDPPTSWSDDGTGVTRTRSNVQVYAGSYSQLIDATNASTGAQQFLTAVSGSYYEIVAYFYITAGAARVQSLFGFNSLQIVSATGAWYAAKLLDRTSTASPRLYLRSDAAAATFYADAVSALAVTPNAQLTAPSANMRTDFFYTLPGTPAAGDQIWVLPRISDFAAGNFWLARLIYTGSQWDINLYSVATFTRTSRIAATNIGATNGIRVTANGNDWTLETTANGGTNWTSRGTVNNSTYNTATGVNVLYTSSVTAGNLLYAPA